MLNIISNQLWQLFREATACLDVRVIIKAVDQGTPKLGHALSRILCAAENILPMINKYLQLFHVTCQFFS